jgi:hypothetical protein
MKYLKLSIAIFLGIILLTGCCSSKIILNCGNLEKSDSVKYFVSGLMDHDELKMEWLKEEIPQYDVVNWLKDYENRINAYNQVTDSSANSKIVNDQLKSDFKKWIIIEHKIRNGDRIFYYSTPKSWWEVLSGQDGLVIIRNCEILYVMVLMQS